MLLTAAVSTIALPGQVEERFHFDRAPRRYLPSAAGLTGGTDPDRADTMVLMDVDNDGLKDLIVGSSLARGAGTGFLPATQLLNGIAAMETVAGDIDGDGIRDLIQVGRPSGQSTPALQVLRGNGSGGFAAGAVIPLPWGEMFLPSLLVADVDGDGRSDPIVAHISWNQTSELVHVRRSSGGTQTLTYGSDLDPAEIACRDVDGDGQPDLVAVLNRRGGGPGELAVHRNLGGGIFATAPSTTALPSNGVFGLDVADIDGDGDLDALMTHPDPILDRTFLLSATNPGTGAFPPPQAIPVFDSYQLAVDVYAEHLNGDGAVDLAISFGQLAATLRGGSGGTFSLLSAISLRVGQLAVDRAGPLGEARIVTAGRHVIPMDRDGRIGTTGLANGSRLQALFDFNRDNRLDVATVDPFSAIVTVLLGDGEGGVAGTLAFSIASMPPIGELEAADLDADGFPDLLLHSSLVLGALRNQGGVGFQLVQTNLAPLQSSCDLGEYGSTLADLNGDGFPDLLRTARHAPECLLAYGSATGAFTPSCMPLPAWMGELATGDINGDGFRDAVMLNRSTLDLTVLRGSSLGLLFAAPQAVALSADTFGDITLGDIDLDGDLDIVVGSHQGLLVATNNGAGVFVETQHLLVAGTPRWYDLSLVDLDGDRRPDLVGRGNSANHSFFRIFRNTASGFTSDRLAWDFTLAQASSRLDVGDFDGDSYPDIIAGGQMADLRARVPMVYPNRSALRGFGVPRGGQSVRLELRQPASPSALYVLLAGVNGTAPGLPLGGGAVLPLNPTLPLFDLILNGGAGIFSGFVGLLDANGSGTATFTLPPGFVPPIGFDVDFAFLTVGAGSGAIRTSNVWSVRVE